MGEHLGRLSSLFTEVAQAEDFAGLVEREDPAGWAFALTEDSPLVEITLDEHRGVAVVSADLGRFLGDDETAFLPLVVGYACAHDVTGGLRLGRRPDEGDYVLYGDVAIEALRRDNLGALLRGFTEKAEQWGAVLAGRGQPDVPAIVTDEFMIRA